MSNTTNTPPTMKETKPIMEHDGPATIVNHCAATGRSETFVRKVTVGPVQPWAQYERSVTLCFWEPRKKRGWSRVVYGNLGYVTIEAEGGTIYDSRNDVPCDMEEWQKAEQDIQARRTASRMEGGTP